MEPTIARKQPFDRSIAMKLEGISDLYFVLSIFVPGFIYNGVLRQFVPLHESTLKETVFLKLLTATAFNYALCSPLIYFFLYRTDVFAIQWRMVAWFIVIFLAPVVFALVRARLIQTTRPDRLYRYVGLRPINPIPTGWDWIFSRTGTCFVLVTLTDGTVVAGFFGGDSMASSDPDRRDIYIEKLYTIPSDGGPWIEVKGSLGMQIDGSQIAYIEFRR
jgi:hypothetical protein